MEPAVGLWAMACCEQDLHRIETEDEVAEILDVWRDRDECGEYRDIRIFPTREAAWDEIFPYVEHWPNGVTIRVYRPISMM